MDNIKKLNKCLSISNKIVKRLDEIYIDVIVNNNHEVYVHELNCINKVYNKIMRVIINTVI